MSLIKAWEESEKAKAENKYVNMFLYNFPDFFFSENRDASQKPDKSFLL
jgi:hypothetical protein